MHDVLVPVPGGELNVWHRPANDGAPTAILIHGLTGTSRWWVPVMTHLPQRLGIVAIDARGRGASWQAPPPHDLATLADDSVRALDHLGLETATVAGYSMGAWIAALIQKRHSARVNRLVLVDGGLATDIDPRLDVEEALAGAVGPSVARLEMEFADREAYLAWWREHPSLSGRWHHELDRVFDYEIRPIDGMWRVRANREAIVEGGRGITVDPDVKDVARLVDAPTILLVVDHGMLDEPGGFIPLQTATEAANDNESITVSLHEGLNHYTLMLGEGASLVAEAIAAG